MTPTRLYTLKELSDHVGRSIWTLRGAIKDGLLDYHQEREGGIITVSLEQWEAYLERTLKNASDPKPALRPRRRGAVHEKPDRRRKSSRRDPARYADLTW